MARWQLSFAGENLSLRNPYEETRFELSKEGREGGRQDARHGYDENLEILATGLLVLPLRA